MIPSAQSSLDSKVRGCLTDGEEVFAKAFGLHGYPKSTERQMKLWGLYFIGAFLNLALSDRIYFVLTSRRLLMLEVSPKYARHLGTAEIESRGIVVTEVSSWGPYVLLEFLYQRGDHAAEEYRIRFPKWQTAFKRNADNAKKLIDCLQVSRSKD
ncbi:MAG: hypothetical protein AAF539_12970 [Planctomycetota bacterium]